MSSSLASELNPEQSRALEVLDGPLLILAGAGSGKTRVLTYRMAHLIQSGRARPQEIWATTFTNKAAQEMRTRVSNLLQSLQPHRVEPPWVSTFHSFGAEVLRRYGAVLGLQPYFSIYDDGDQLSLLKRVMKDLHLSEKQWNPKSLRHQMDQLKNRGLDPLAFSKEASTFDREVLYRVYDTYQTRLHAAQAVDFGDLLLFTVKLLAEFPDVKAALQKKYRYFLVDEFQDTNPVQYRFLRLLSDHTHNLCVVGDEDQSIYGWRGADIWNILNFQKDFPDAQVIKLERNYRSTQTIVQAASAVIANNTERMDKHLFSEGDNGDPIQLTAVNNEYEEADRIVESIKNYQREGTSYSDMGLFYRTNAQSRVLEDRLRASRIPYRVYGGLRFYDRAEIKDALSYLRLSVNALDDQAFLRVVNVPARGIGKASIEKILDQRAQEGGVGCLSVCSQEGVLAGKARKGMLALTDLMGEMTILAGSQPALEVYHQWWNASGYIEMLENENNAEADARLENLRELESAIREYQDRVTSPSLTGFLSEIALYTDRNEELAAGAERGLSLMTLHASKGLEYDVVFLVGLEEGLFPSGRAVEENKIEEERRLFYVGITRACRHLHLYYAYQRTSYGVLQPRMTSRFIEELPSQLVERVGGEPRRPKALWSEDDVSDTWQPTRWEQKSPSHVVRDETDDDGLPVIQNQAERPAYARAEADHLCGVYRKGRRVRHHEYGVGIVQKCDGSRGSERLIVNFDRFGERKFMARFAQLEVL